MTDDLVQRLREMGEHPCRVDFPIGADLREAADRIEALQAEVTRLKDKLSVETEPSPYCPICGSCGEEGCCGSKRCMYPDTDTEALQADNARLREAVVKFDALIKHQYTGSQWAMSDMHEAAQFGWKVLQEQSK